MNLHISNKGHDDGAGAGRVGPEPAQRVVARMWRCCVTPRTVQHRGVRLSPVLPAVAAAQRSFGVTGPRGLIRSGL